MNQSDDDAKPAALLVRRIRGPIARKPYRRLRNVALLTISSAFVVTTRLQPDLIAQAQEQQPEDTAVLNVAKNDLDDFETPFDSVDTTRMSPYELKVYQTEKLSWMSENPELARKLRIREARQRLATEEAERLARENEPPPTEEELHAQNLEFMKESVREGIPKEAVATLLDDKEGGTSAMLGFAERLRADTADEDGDNDRTLADDPPFLQQIREQRVPAFISHVKHGNYDVNRRDVRGQTALHYCCMLRGDGTVGERNRQAIKALLMQPTVDVNKLNGMKEAPLHYAMRGAGSVSVVEELVNADKLEVNLKDGRAKTALRVAVDADFAPGFNLLLEKHTEVDPNIKANDGFSPFLSAVSNSRYSMIRPLVAAGADMRAADNGGNNCFHLALRKDSEVLPFLLDALGRWRRGDIASLSSLQAVPSDKLADEQDVPIILPDATNIRDDDPLNAGDSAGNTPMHIAASSSNASNIARLLRAGGNTALRNKSGKTPRDIAIQHGRVQTWDRAVAFVARK